MQGRHYYRHKYTIMSFCSMESLDSEISSDIYIILILLNKGMSYTISLWKAINLYFQGSHHPDFGLSGTLDMVTDVVHNNFHCILKYNMKRQMVFN